MKLPNANISLKYAKGQGFTADHILDRVPCILVPNQDFTGLLNTETENQTLNSKAKLKMHRTKIPSSGLVSKVRGLGLKLLIPHFSKCSGLCVRVQGFGLNAECVRILNIVFRTPSFKMFKTRVCG